jgi:histidyl-tRNA synthetase
MAKDNTPASPITGFPEWLPGERLQELAFLDTIRQTFELYGFTPIETSAVEKDETLASKGEIDKQVYGLYRPNVPEDADRETGLSLHFDLTVPLARYVAQNYGKLVFPFRRYQIQKVWRGERPQKGRFREFYQCDIDIVGEGDLGLLADAEMAMVICDIFTRLDIGDFVMRLSNRKVLQGFLGNFGIAGEASEETVRAIDRLPKLRGGWEELAAWLGEELGFDEKILDPLRQLVSVRGPGQQVLPAARELGIENPLFLEGLAELEELTGHLAALRVAEKNVEVDFSITRGLDYYTGTVYETFLVAYETKLGSVCSGGRYENLASKFIDRQLPGVGLSIGLSRLFSGLLEAGKLDTERQTPAQVFVSVPEWERLSDSLGIASELRATGLKVELFVQDKKHDKQLKTAVRKGIPYAVIAWPEKLAEGGQVEIRDLTTGDRETVPRSEAGAKIREWMARA